MYGVVFTVLKHWHVVGRDGPPLRPTAALWYQFHGLNFTWLNFAFLRLYIQRTELDKNNHNSCKKYFYYIDKNIFTSVVIIFIEFGA